VILRGLVLLAIAVVAGAAGGVAGYAIGQGDAETDTVTTTTTLTSATASGLPPAVEETRTALLEAADSGSYDALRPLIPASGFEYTFGTPVEGGPIAYWQDLERTTDERPLETLGTILRLPYVLSRGYYVWPWVYTLESPGELSEHERALLAPLGEIDSLFPTGEGYFGWRTGIAPDGSWTFFVAGD
jgi:hypothetical protein